MRKPSYSPPLQNPLSRPSPTRGEGVNPKKTIKKGEVKILALFKKD
jgi:hypothetical protein